MTRGEAQLIVELIDVVIKLVAADARLPFETTTNLMHIQVHFENAARGYATNCAKHEKP